MPADPTMRTHCDDCDRRDLCDIIKRGTAPCRQNAGMGLAAADLLADFRAEVDRLRAERDSADPTPAAPDPQHVCECMSCRAKRAFGYAIGCCPKKLSHGALCTCGSSSAAPDQAEGPQPPYDPRHREIL